MYFPWDCIRSFARLGSGRARPYWDRAALLWGSAAPGHLRHLGTRPGHPTFHSEVALISHLILPTFCRELSSGFVTCPPVFKCSFWMESWEARLWKLWLCRGRWNSLGFISGKAKQARSCAWSCSYKSMEGERIFHPLVITADEQTMTTLCPFGLIIQMKNLKSLSVVFCLKFWKILRADCISKCTLYLPVE